MFEFLRKYVDSLAGVTELPRGRAEQLVQELQKRGEVRVKDVRRAAEQLVERSNRNRRELIALVQKEIRRQVKALGLATQDDVAKLSKRVRSLEGARTTGGPARAATRAKTTGKAPAKRPAASGPAPRRTTGASPKR